MPDTPSPTPPFATTRPALPGGAPCALPGEDALELDLLRGAVANDWGPRDAYERHWAGELVAAMRRQQLLRGLELKVLAVAEMESPPTEATLQRLLGFARYGARIDRDIGAALRALRVLRNRPDAWIVEPAMCTREPEPRPASTRARTSEPGQDRSQLATDPDRLAFAPRRPTSGAVRTPEPEPSVLRATAPLPAPPLNRHERRRREALARRNAGSVAA